MAKAGGGAIASDRSSADLKAAKMLRRPRCQRREHRPRTHHHRDGNAVRKILPMAPTVERHKIITSHQPHETQRRKPLLQSRDRIDRVPRVDLRFDIGHANTRRMSCDPARACKALVQRSHSMDGFQRILRRHKPPDIIETKAFQRDIADMQMTFMRRIE